MQNNNHSSSPTSNNTNNNDGNGERDFVQSFPTRLDARTKVSLMAALIWSSDPEMTPTAAVKLAFELDHEVGTQLLALKAQNRRQGL